MRVKGVRNGCGGAGCDKCGGRRYALRFEIAPDVTCCVCGKSFRDGSQEAEFIGWPGKCAQCEIESEYCS